MARFDRNRFRTENQTWETPDPLFQCLDNEFNFEVDLAANSKNTKCKKFISIEQNALNIPWQGIGWLNPPYGGTQENAIKRWVVVMLIPARTNTEWWHNFCMKAKEIRFIRGRPKFKGNIHGLPQPLAIIVFENTNKKTKLKSYEVKCRHSSHN